MGKKKEKRKSHGDWHFPVESMRWWVECSPEGLIRRRSAGCKRRISQNLWMKCQKFSVGPWISIPAQSHRERVRKISSRQSEKAEKTSERKFVEVNWMRALNVKDTTGWRSCKKAVFSERRKLLGKRRNTILDNENFRWRVESTRVHVCVCECDKKKIFLSKKRAYPPWNFPCDENFVIDEANFLRFAFRRLYIIGVDNDLSRWSIAIKLMSRFLLLPRFLLPKAEASAARRRSDTETQFFLVSQWMKF